MTDTNLIDAVVFPQDDGTGVPDGSESYDSAGSFSLLSRYKGDGNYVGEDTSGDATLQFNDVDTSNNEFDVGTGHAYISDSVSIQSGAQTTYDTTLPDDVPYVVVLPNEVTNLSLDSGTNDVWLAVNPTSNDDVYIRHGSGLSAPSDPSVKLGTIDASSGDTTRAKDNADTTFSSVTTDALADVADAVIGTDDDLPSRIANDVAAGDLVAIGPGTHEYGLSSTSGLSDSIFEIADDDVTLELAPGAVIKLADNEVSPGDQASGFRVTADNVTVRGDGTFDGNRANNSVSSTDDFEIVRVSGVDNFTLTGVECRNSPGKSVSAGQSSTQGSNIKITDTDHVNCVEGAILANFNGVRFSNNEVRDIDQDGVEPVGCTRVVVSDSTFKNCGREAIDLFDGNVRAVVTGCVIEGIGSDSKSPAVSVAGRFAGNQHVVVANLSIADVFGDAPAIGVGVEFQGGTNSDVLITDNEIDHAYAYKIQDATDVRVEGGKHSSAVTVPLEVVDADASAPIYYDGPQLAAARRLEFVPAWVDVAWSSDPIAEQVNAALSHRYRTLSDSDWVSVDGGSSFTFSIAGSPQTLDVSHDGSGSDTYGHLTSLAAVDPGDFDTGFRLWFRNVTFTENNGDNELYVGITDTPGSGGLTIRNSGALFYLTGGAQIFRVNGGNNGFPGGFVSGEDLLLEYDGSSVSLSVTGSVGALSVSFSQAGPFTPVLMVKDASGNTQSETLACERVELEPL